MNVAVWAGNMGGWLEQYQGSNNQINQDINLTDLYIFIYVYFLTLNEISHLPCHRDWKTVFS